MTGLTMAKITETVSLQAEVTVAEIKGPYRDRRIIRARHLVWLLIRDRLNLSYPQIGRDFNRDHTSIISGIANAETMLCDDPAFRALYRACIDDLRAAPGNDSPPTRPRGPDRATPDEASYFRRLREMRCARKETAHACQGRFVIDNDGFGMDCPICGERRSVFPGRRSVHSRTSRKA